MRIARLAAACAALLTLAAVEAGAEYIFRHRLVGAASVAAAATGGGGGTGTRIFVTAAAHKGNLGGTAGADAKCMADANRPADGRTYVAMIGNSAQGAKQRISVTYPVRFAANPATVYESTDLWSGSREAAFPALAVGEYVWTGTNASGAPHAGYLCADWTDGTNGYGATGQPDRTGGTEWAFYVVHGCGFANRLYCVSTTP